MSLNLPSSFAKVLRDGLFGVPGAIVYSQTTYAKHQAEQREKEKEEKEKEATMKRIDEALDK